MVNAHSPLFRRKARAAPALPVISLDSKSKKLVPLLKNECSFIVFCNQLSFHIK